MLKASQLPGLLSQMNTEGVVCTVLMTNNGSVLQACGSSEAQAMLLEENVIAAIVANIWNDLKTANSSDTLDVVMIECSEGNVAATKVLDKFILAGVGGSIELGLLKMKLESMKAALEKELQALYVFSNES